MAFHITLVDDDKGEQEATLALLEAYRLLRPQVDLCVTVFSGGAALLDHPKACDAYLLDILMPGLDGIELARRLRARDRDIPIIFLTSSPDYALDAFAVSACQYLLKPVKAPPLYEILDKLSAAEKREDGFIMVQTRESARRVAFSSIIYVEVWGRNLRFSLVNGETLTSRTLRVPFSAAVSSLFTDRRFLHAHKSYVLNMERVHELTPRSFIMVNGVEIPIPRYKYSTAKNSYFDYLGGK